MWSPIRARSSRPKPISDPIADAISTPPMSARSAAAASKPRFFSSPRCSRKPEPAASGSFEEPPMAKDKSAPLTVKTFADHHVITRPNPLRRVLRRADEKDLDDPVARAEQALAGLSGEFSEWMTIECER